MDGSVRGYDLESGLIVDWMQFEDAVTSMSFSFDGCFLATTHRNTVGIHIWSNKHHFGEPFLKAVGTSPILMDKVEDEQSQKEQDKKQEIEVVVNEIMEEREWRSENEDEDEDESSSEQNVEDILDLDADSESEEDSEWNAVDELDLPDIASLHLDGDRPLMTMSANPKSVWKNLAHWEEILVRNQPTVRVKKHKAVERIPFFIPTKAGSKDLRKMEMDTTSFTEEMKREKEEMQRVETTRAEKR